jgi:hypothetical protein
MLGKFVFVLGLMMSIGVMAEETPCNVAAAEKKLASAAKQSFLKQCEVTARASCEREANQQNLSGAAKIKFAKKCLYDAMGD